jgi:chaperone modulatory protein CbpM
MMTLEGLLGQVEGVAAEDVRRWIAARYVRPGGAPEAWVFGEMDVARVRLIVELRDVMEISEPALPTVLSLLDQVYDLRRRMRRLNEGFARLPAEMRAELARFMME